MKKILIAAGLILFAAGSASARDQALYDIADSSLDLAVIYIAFSGSEGSCTDDDGLVLKTAAEWHVRELVELITSGKMRSLKLTAEQVVALNMKAKALRAQFAHAEVFGFICNVSAKLFYLGVFFFEAAYVASQILTGLWLGLLVVVFCIIIGILSILLSLIIAPACFLWWL